VKPQRESIVQRLLKWWRLDGKWTIVSWDVGAGVLVGLGLYFGGKADHRVIPGPAALYVQVALGAAILAVVLTALSILVAFLGEEYIQLLEQSVTVKRAIFPYQVVGFLAACEVLSALMTVTIWNVVPRWVHDMTSAITAGFTTAAVIGTVQIINLTARHGLRRARIPEIRRAARDALVRRKSG